MQIAVRRPNPEGRRRLRRISASLVVVDIRFISSPPRSLTCLQAPVGAPEPKYWDKLLGRGN